MASSTRLTELFKLEKENGDLEFELLNGKVSLEDLQHFLNVQKKSGEQRHDYTDAIKQLYRENYATEKEQEEMYEQAKQTNETTNQTTKFKKVVMENGKFIPVSTKQTDGTFKQPKPSSIDIDAFLPELSNIDADKVKQAFYETKWTPELIGYKDFKFCVYYSELNSMNPLMVTTKEGLNVPYAHYRMYGNVNGTKAVEQGDVTINKVKKSSKYLPESCAHEEGSLGNQIFMTGLHVFRDELEWNKYPLTIVEGAKKAFYLCSKGVPAVGMLGISGFYTTTDKEGNKCDPRPADSFENTGLQAYVFAHLQKTINGKEAELRLILDADAFDGDVKRRNLFTKAIKAFRTIYKGFKISFAVPDRENGEKGIDDLLNTLPYVKNVNNCLEIWDMTDKEQIKQLENEFTKTQCVDKYIIVEKTMVNHGVNFRWNTLKSALEISWMLHDDPTKRNWHIASEQEIVVFKSRAEFDGRKISSADLDEVLDNIERVSPEFNRITEFEKKISKWDGVNRFEEFASKVYLKDEAERPMFNTQLRKFLIRSLACTLKCPKGMTDVDPKTLSNVAENRTAFIFQSVAENIGKTKFWEFLLGDFSDLIYTNSFSDDKDYRIELTQNIFMNLDELDRISPKVISSMKSLISTASIKDRLSYDKRAIERTRIANYIGSCNDTSFLPAYDQNSRWIIFSVKGFNWKGADGYMQFDPMDIMAELYAEWKNDILAGELEDSEFNYVLENSKKSTAMSQEAELINDTYVEVEGIKGFHIDDIVGALRLLYPNTTIDQAKVRKGLKNIFGESKSNTILPSGKKGRGYRIKMIEQETYMSAESIENDEALKKIFKMA